MALFDSPGRGGGAGVRRFTLRAFMIFLLVLASSALSWANGSGAGEQAAEPVVAAAADLKFALEEIARSFRRETGKSVKLIFGSSGTIAAQIRNGAPFQVYLSADEKYVTDLHAAGYTRDAGTLYALGRIVVIAPYSSKLRVDATLQGVAAQLKAGRLKRFAIANPEHAPYGRRAEEALRKAGVWTRIRPKLVLGENVAQAAQFATSGSADGGIIALSLAKSPQLASKGNFAVIPADWHTPLKQRMVLLKNAGATAHSFYSYLQAPAARAVLRRYGFELPVEVK